MSFCHLLNSTFVEVMGCGNEKTTMAIMKLSNATCAVLAGGDPFTDAKFEVENPDDDQGIDINFNGEQPGFSLTA